MVSGELQHELRRAEDLLDSTRAAFLALSKDRLSGAVPRRDLVAMRGGVRYLELHHLLRTHCALLTAVLLVLTPTGPADPTLLAAVQAAVKAASAADAAEANSRSDAPPKQPS